MTGLEKIHRGKWISDQIKKAGFTHTEICYRLPLSYSNIMLWFKKENLDFIRMKKIADIIRIDLREAFPESSYVYGDKTPEQEIHNLDYKEKYLALMEKHLELQRENARLKEGKQ